MNIQTVMEWLEDKPYSLLDAIQNRFVNPLLAFRTTCQNIDIYHTTSYLTFGDLVFSLIGSNPAITGAAANALADKYNMYDLSEQDELGDGISVRINEIATICESTANELQFMLDTFLPAQLTDLKLPIPTSMLAIADGLCAAEEVYGVTPAQLAQLELMGIVRKAWVSALENLADESLAPATRLPDILVANDYVLSFFSLPPVQLTPSQKLQATNIIATLAGAGIPIPYDYVAALLARGFSETDILSAVSAWKKGGKSNQDISELLFLAAFNYTLAPYYNGGIPYGFNSKADFQDFTTTLATGLQGASGIGGDNMCVSATVGGSAVTGVQFKRGVPFDQGRTSDYDIVLSSPELLNKAKAMGINTYEDGLHTRPLSDEELQELGLYDLERQLTSKANRPVHFIIYSSRIDNYAHTPYITFLQNSCNGS